MTTSKHADTIRDAIDATAAGDVERAKTLFKQVVQAKAEEYVANGYTFTPQKTEEGDQ